MIRFSQARWRWLGTLSLAAGIGMVVAGDTTSRGWLGSGPCFIGYWLLCFLFTVAAIVFAFLDVRALRRRTREQHQALLESTVQSIQQEKKRKAETARRP